MSQNDTVGDLSEAEVKLIQQHRQRQEEERQRNLLRIEVLEAALAYERWLQQEGRGDSYSTFCNEFAYEGSERNEVMHRRVQQVLSQLS